jgi:hypothetical protein
MKKAIILFVGGLAIYALAMIGYNRFVSSYNSVIGAERETIKQRVQTLQDSIPLIEQKYKELKRIKELSFRRPITPEHVRGEELRAVILGMTSCEVWLFNKRSEQQFLQQQLDELNESLISLQ